MASERGRPRRILAPLAAVAVSLLAATAPRPALAAECTVFAAASTAEALADIAQRYEAEGGPRVSLVFAASSMLARQIENGAPADLFLSADEPWMDYLEKRRLIAAGSRVDLLGNRLILVAPAWSALALTIAPGFPLAEALGNGRLALGDPDHVPAGIYAKAALESLGVWRQVAGKLLPSSDVRAALVYVERGEAAAGIVYRTDATRAKVRVIGSFPEDSHPPIRYPLALVAGRTAPAARAFYDYLRGPAARAAFEKSGFTFVERPR